MKGFLSINLERLPGFYKEQCVYYITCWSLYKGTLGGHVRNKYKWLYSLGVEGQWEQNFSMHMLLCCLIFE